MNPTKKTLTVTALIGLLATATFAADPVALLTPAAEVKIASAKGKFDFLEVDPVHHVLLAAHEKCGTADFINLADNTLITRVDTGPAVHIALDTKTDQYFVSCSDEKKITILDAKSLKKVGEIATEGELDALLYEPKVDKVYITNDEGDHVWVIDPNAQKVAATIDIKGPPEYMVYDPASDRIYLNLKKENKILVIDPNTNTAGDMWSTEPAENPHGLGFDPATHTLFAAGGNGFLAAIDLTTGKVTSSAEIAKGVDQAVFDPKTKKVYCAAGATWTVVKAGKKGLKALGNVAMPATAKNVAVDPTTDLIWTTYTEGEDSFAKAFKQ